ncbi:hypothetical protein E2C01_033216 [Portunus trituberculatus]|uniref:Uncharacterized protein n=1 Tax=Portunus trituberculatus TaxID=210409 RepID=A0A5B7EY52_PORTR|nr:hypothetical protein [Portunus trituberculatus]
MGRGGVGGEGLGGVTRSAGQVSWGCVARGNTCGLLAHVSLMELSSYRDYSDTNQRRNLSWRENVDCLQEEDAK